MITETVAFIQILPRDVAIIHDCCIAIRDASCEGVTIKGAISLLYVITCCNAGRDMTLMISQGAFKWCTITSSSRQTA